MRAWHPDPVLRPLLVGETVSVFALPRLPGEPYELVLDIGGNVGDFAAAARGRWPQARIVSFEPIPQLADASWRRAYEDAHNRRWEVLTVALGAERGERTIYLCANQHSASTMLEPGGARKRHFGIDDEHRPLTVEVGRLDDYLGMLGGCERVLVKIDVEGFEGEVIAGGGDVLSLAACVIVECQQDADLFVGAPTPGEVDAGLRRHGLAFWGVADALASPSGRLLQFDGIWARPGVEP